MFTKDLNAGYCCSHGLCCFSMISSEGPEALVAMGQAVAICQHHLYMAFSEAPTGRPRGGEMACCTYGSLRILHFIQTR